MGESKLKPANGLFTGQGIQIRWRKARLCLLHELSSCRPCDWFDRNIFLANFSWQNLVLLMAPSDSQVQMKPLDLSFPDDLPGRMRNKCSEELVKQCCSGIYFFFGVRNIWLGWWLWCSAGNTDFPSCTSYLNHCLNLLGIHKWDVGKSKIYPHWWICVGRVSRSQGEVRFKEEPSPNCGESRFTIWKKTFSDFLPAAHLISPYFTHTLLGSFSSLCPPKPFQVALDLFPLSQKCLSHPAANVDHARLPCEPVWFIQSQTLSKGGPLTLHLGPFYLHSAGETGRHWHQGEAGSESSLTVHASSLEVLIFAPHMLFCNVTWPTGQPPSSRNPAVWGYPSSYKCPSHTGIPEQ